MRWSPIKCSQDHWYVCDDTSGQADQFSPGERSLPQVVGKANKQTRKQMQQKLSSSHQEGEREIIAQSSWPHKQTNAKNTYQL